MHRHNPALRHKAAMRGFTLLEVLIGMSLLGIMMVLLFGSLRVCVQNWDAGETKIADVSQSMVIRNFFINHLQSLLPLQNDFTEEKSFSFQGDINSLQFVSSMPASAGRLGLQLFTVALDQAKREGGNITVATQPFFPVDDNQGWKVEEITILKQVKKLKFSYFGVDPQKPQEPATWTDTWLKQTTSPLLVKVEIELMNGVTWPEIVVEPKVDSSAITTNPFGIVNGRFSN